jgi:hypothetical protein
MKGLGLYLDAKVWTPAEQLARAVEMAEQWHLRGKDEIGLLHLACVVRRVLPLLKEGGRG